MKLRIITLALAGICLVSPLSSLAATAVSATAPVSATQAGKADQALRKLVDGYFRENLALNPLNAPDMGVNTYNDRFGDYLSNDYLFRQKALETRYLEAIRKVDRSQLSADGQITYDVFLYDRQMALKGFDFPFWYLPLNHFYSKASTIAEQGSGEYGQPFATVRDYDNFLKKLDGFGRWADMAVQRMRQGQGEGVTLAAPLAKILEGQLRDYVPAKLEDSQFWKPVMHFPKNFSAADKARLTKAYRAKIQEVVNPAYLKLADFLKNEYQPRQTLGWQSLPNGAAWYQYLADLNTTTTLPAQQIHNIGKQEVARILGEMETVRQQVGFKGDLKAFWKYLQTDPKFFWTDPKQQVSDYVAFRDRVYPVLPKFFGLMPKAPYEVRAVPKESEDTAGVAYYNPGTPDGKRPGVFFVNTKPGQQLPKWSLETLAMHEAAPGHHFQIAIKQEQKGVPEYRKFRDYTAYEEGWAVYVESIGRELGMEKDPLQYFGKLNEEMLRAMRLVVDTGLHTQGWTIEQAEAYMLANSALGEGDVRSEVRRYLAIPGQALSYKVGQLTISRLRAESQQALGPRFDIRRFHDQVLGSGALPMSVLEAKVHNWVKSGG